MIYNNVKRHFLISGLAFLLCACVSETSDFNADKTGVTEVELSSAEMTLKVGGTSRLTATVHPWNADETEVTWSSTDSTVAKVNDSGTVTAIKIGSATVKAECGGIFGECLVSVVTADVPCDSIKMIDTPVALKKGMKQTVSITIMPRNCTEKAVWTSSDESVVTVSETGQVTAVGSGRAIITVTVGSVVRTIHFMVYDGYKVIQTDALEKPVSFTDFTWNLDTIRVARGETATVQMIIHAEGNAGQVTPSVSYFAPKGQNSGLAVTPELYWLPDIYCSVKWDAWAGGAAPDRYPDSQRNLPDPMIPVSDRTVTLESNGKIPVWAEFDIPHTMQAGIYEGMFTATGAATGECPFVVQVYDVDLPEKQSLDIMQWVNSNLAAMNGGDAPEMYGVFDRIEKIIVPLVRKFGQNCFDTNYAHRYNMKQTLVKNSAGEYELQVDFSDLEREIEMYLRACPDLHYVQWENQIASNSKKSEGILVISGYKMNDDGEIAATDNGDGTYSFDYEYYDQKDEVFKGAELFYSHFFHALQEFLRSHKLDDGRTWLDIFLQTIFDEPGDEVVAAYQNIASYIKKGAPELKIMEPLSTHKIGAQYIDFPCPIIGSLEGSEGYPWTDSQTRWIYSANSPQGDGINRYIRIPLIKTRLMHWLNYRYSATGYLHWGLNYWSGAKNGDPWTDASGWQLGGDCFIIWPGDNVVYPSIRLAAMRDGIRDYDLLKLLCEVDPAQAMSLCIETAYDYKTHNTDIEHFRKVRKTILETLEKN